MASLDLTPLSLSPAQIAAIERERANHAARYPGTDQTVAKDAASFCTFLMTAQINSFVREGVRSAIERAQADPAKFAALGAAAKTILGET